MKVELKVVTLEEVPDLAGARLDYAAASDLMVELKYDGIRAGLIGFIPRDGDAYLWMEKGPLALTHATSFARYAKKIVDCYATKYQSLRGHSNEESRRWLTFLGAEIEALPGSNIVEFTIHGK